MSDYINYFAQTDYRNNKKKFGIKQPDRRLHMHIIGKTGTGKTSLLKNLIIQDIRNGHGVGVIDPHGDMITSILDHIPSHRNREVVYFNPADQEYPVGFNILEAVNPSQRPLVASQIISVFKNIWRDSWGPRLEYVLFNSVISLLDVPGSTLLSIPRLLYDQDFRSRVVAHLSDPLIKNFWKEEFEKYNTNFQTEAISPVLNKVGQFLTSSFIRNIVGQTKSKIDMGFIMDNQRVFLCNLSKGEIGEDKSKLLGSLIVTKFFLAALKRAEQAEEERKDFHLYIDECQTLATDIFASILSEARKYRLSIVIANQFLDQLNPGIQKAIIGNVGTLICFRVGSQDAMTLEAEFSSQFNSYDIENLEKYKIYLKMAIDGQTSRPFSARTLPPETIQRNENNRENIIKTSRQKYGMKKDVVEKKINQWFS